MSLFINTAHESLIFHKPISHLRELFCKQGKINDSCSKCQITSPHRVNHLGTLLRLKESGLGTCGWVCWWVREEFAAADAMPLARQCSVARGA